MMNHEFGEGKEAYNIWDFGLGWKITDTVALNGSYSWNTMVDEGFDKDPADNTDLSGAKHAWSVELDYKGADPADKGSWGAFVAYRKLGAAAVLAPTYDGMKAGQKGVEMGVDFVPMKNFQATFKYFIGNDLGVRNADDDASKFFTELNFFF